MTKITNFVAYDGSTYNDNSLTINAQQNNTQFNLDSEVAKGTDGKEEKGRKIRFVAAKGQKVNLCRVIMALQQSGYFKNANGGEATQDDVFPPLERFSDATCLISATEYTLAPYTTMARQPPPGCLTC